MEKIRYNSVKRRVPVSIGGTSWKPPMPIKSHIKAELAEINTQEESTERGITMMLYRQQGSNRRFALCRAAVFLRSNRKPVRKAGRRNGIIKNTQDYLWIKKGALILYEETLFGVQDKVQLAISRLKAFEPPEGYYLAFSGGKDSQSVYHLCKEAGVKFDAHYHLTTVDPPELVYFIRKHYPDVITDRPNTTMWDLIVQKGMPPTRLTRYCCDELKEGGGSGRIVVTGVRWDESKKRKKNWGLLELNSFTKGGIKLMNDNDEARRMFETCVMKSQHTLNPIIDWNQEDVWEYLHTRHLSYCSLYDEGFTRLGCIGCPLAGAAQMKREFARYPKYEQAYLRAFDRMLETRRAKLKPYTKWHCAEDVMKWWLDEGKSYTPIENQLSFSGLDGGEIWVPKE